MRTNAATARIMGGLAGGEVITLTSPKVWAANLDALRQS
jgi:hypothetical protein